MIDYKEDHFKNTKHFGLFCDDQFVSGLTLIKSKVIKVKHKQYQIRGMFTASDHLRKGFGSMLILNLSKFLKTNEKIILWCNSRTSAVNFYKKNNFVETGKAFNKKFIGSHKKVIRYFHAK